ncbi:exopolygalacturonase-like protein [Tanacetum coccineum]
MFSFIYLLPLFFFLSLAIAYDVRPTFNVLSYGANPNRFTENSNAFFRAWHAACASNMGGRVLVPRGSYVLGAVVFLRPCKGPVDFIIKGTLEASDNPVNMFRDHWITFRPGNGFSIGSLGKYDKEQPVSRITIRDSSLKRTQNGLRIKTWAPSTPTLASDIIFDNIVMYNVNNPIFIDQQYCPHNLCNSRAQSNVQIRNVTFSEVRGTSSSQLAVKLQCSKNVPCEDIKLKNINLAYHGPEGPVASSCVNAGGRSYGFQLPSGCL